MKKFEGVILACDMDGTLLDDNHQIPKRNLDALHYFAEQGGLFSIATGRNPAAAEAYFEKLPINTFYCLLNGSLIYNQERELVYCNNLKDSVKELIEFSLLNNSQIGCEILCTNQILIRKMSDVTKYHMTTLKLDYEEVSQAQLSEIKTDDWCKINFTGTPEQIVQLQHSVASYQTEFAMTSSLPYFWEVTAHGISKGVALEKISTMLNLSRKNIYAIGDSYNDESMLTFAEVGFAPANAEEGILSLSDVQVCSNNQGAVADAIEWLDERY